MDNCEEDFNGSKIFLKIELQYGHHGSRLQKKTPNDLHEVVFCLCLVDVYEEGRPEVPPTLGVEEILPQ